MHVQREQQCAEAEQRNRCQKKSGTQVAQPARIPFKTQVAQALDLDRAKQWPKQNQGCNQKRAMKKSFEIEPGQRWKNIMRRQPVRRPEQNRRKQRAEENGRGEVNQQSDCVFQDC